MTLFVFSGREALERSVQRKRRYCGRVSTVAYVVAQVYLMRDKVKRNFVCVKIIKIKNIPKKEREATRVEVDLLRRLNHPNIVRYVDSFLSKNGESLCICMEYCDGVSAPLT